MSLSNQRRLGREARHARIRKRVVGSPQRPRLSLFRSHNHLYAQIIDDMAGKTLLGCSTKDERLKLSSGGTVLAAQMLGKFMAGEASSKGIQKVVFDRGGYVYHGRVKAFADAVRSGGLQV
jgi:large subunit ribosomal protein L18